jgi:hypothetical protein
MAACPLTPPCSRRAAPLGVLSDGVGPVHNYRGRGHFMCAVGRLGLGLHGGLLEFEEGRAQRLASRGEGESVVFDDALDGGGDCREFGAGKVNRRHGFTINERVASLKLLCRRSPRLVAPEAA